MFLLFGYVATLLSILGKSKGMHRREIWRYFFRGLCSPGRYKKDNISIPPRPPAPVRVAAGQGRADAGTELDMMDIKKGG